MRTGLRIKTMSSTHGEVVSLRSSGVTVIVGANNAGKSQLLRDLEESAHRTDNGRCIVLDSVEWEFQVGDRGETEWILESRALPLRGQGGARHYLVNPNGFQVDDAARFHDDLASRAEGGMTPGHFSGLFLRRVPAGSLHRFAAGSLRTEFNEDRQYNWLLERAYSEGDVAARVQELLRRLFHTEVFLDHANHPAAMRVGVPTVTAPPINAPTSQYSRAVAELPLLDEQGDGLRSIAGLALLIHGLAPDVLLLDEPEAFLHPGQARAVGRWLSEAADSMKIQILIATHDRDLLTGILDSSAGSDVQLVRVSRETSGSRFTIITDEQRQKYREDPILRHSNVLQGLFHERVVICEAYDDCGFYSAGLSEMAASEGLQHVVDDTLFLPSLGKNGMANLAKVLVEMGVDTRAVVDFDFLNNHTSVESLVRVLGGDWPECEGLYNAATAHTRGLNNFWPEAKKRGMAQVPYGDATMAFDLLLKWLDRNKLHAVRTGELESFFRECGKSAEWLGKALAGGAHVSMETMDFLGRVVPEVRA